MKRTSASHPLLIDEIACGAGLIGMTFCPGKQGDSVFGAPWARDLDVDLAVIAAWRPAAVVTLMEDHEFDLLGVGGLGVAIEAAGVEWHHLPIRDLGAPDERFERCWLYAGHVLRTHLRAGRRVLVHCRGGRGRTGLLAGQLLAEFGVEPSEAVRRVRAAREGAIETPAQLSYVVSRRQLDHDPAHLDRLLGCVLGGAVGDAFGYAIEFDRLEEIKARHGPKGLAAPIYQGGQLVVSDDTQMTAFTIEGLVRAGRTGEFSLATVTEEVRRAYLDWLKTQRGALPRPRHGLARFESLWRRRAPGNTCLSALKAGGHGAPTSPINNSKGCGGVMRTAPIGLLPQLSSTEAFGFGVNAAALTHGHPSGYLPAGAMSAITRQVLAGRSLAGAVASADRDLSAWEGAEETRAILELAVALADRTDLTSEQAIKRLGEGWVGEEALAIGVYAAAVARDFADAVRTAANHDGDSDSTASIAGQIWGAMHGLEGVPHDWVRRLDVLGALCEVVAGLLELTTIELKPKGVVRA